MDPRPDARVLLLVTPPLLASSLRALLADAGVVSTEDRAQGADLAIVTPDARDVVADVIVVMENGIDGRAAAYVRAGDGTPVVRLDGLSAVMAFVRGWCTRGLEHARGQG